MKTELNASPLAELTLPEVIRPAMVNEVTGPMPAPVAPLAKPARLNLLARRDARWARRAAR